MVNKRILFILMALLFTLTLTACAGGGGGGDAAYAVESYLQALTDKDTDLMVSLSCSEWEEDARTEAAAFDAVETKLQDLSCEVAGDSGEDKLVTCTGKILATYNDENQEFLLEGKSYLVRYEGGDWRMCGYGN